MTISIIVAMSENDVIGRDNRMPWHLSADLKRFKKLTMGHHMIMGRKTFESIGRLLPGRTTIILSRDPDFSFEGALTATSLEAALELAKDDDEVFVVGGGEIYRMALTLAEKLYLTRVHCTVDDGDVTFPTVDWNEYQELQSDANTADEKNDFDFTFILSLIHI